MSDEDEDFQDADPEDAWDDGDDGDTKLDLLERVIDSIRAEKRERQAEEAARRDRAEFRRKDALRLLVKMERERHANAARIEAVREALEKL